MDRVGITQGPFRRGPEVSENSRTGAESRWHWTGSYSECIAQRNFMRVQGIYSNINFRELGDGDYEVSAEWPYDEFGFTPGTVPGVQELEVETAVVDLRQSPKLQSLMSDGDIAQIIRICEEFKSGAASVGTVDALTFNANFTKSQGLANTVNGTYGSKLFNAYVCRGTESCYEYRNVLRLTLTAATNTQAQASFVGVGQIWTTAEILAVEYISPAVFFTLPAGNWLKNPPHVQATHAQKTTLTYSYSAIKTASALLYDAYGSAVLVDL